MVNWNPIWISDFELDGFRLSKLESKFELDFAIPFGRPNRLNLINRAFNNRKIMLLKWSK